MAKAAKNRHFAQAVDHRKQHIVKIKTERGYGDEDWRVTAISKPGFTQTYHLVGIGEKNKGEVVEIYFAHTYQTLEQRLSDARQSEANRVNYARSIGRKKK